MEDKQLKRLILSLGQAINNSLDGDENLRSAVEALRLAGYEPFIVVEATVALSENQNLKLKHDMSPQDKKIMRDFGISFQDEEPE